MSTVAKRVKAGRIDPRLDPFTAEGKTIRDRQCAYAVKLRREGHTFLEIGVALKVGEDVARIFVRSRDPGLMMATKQWTHARRARLLAQFEREQIGPQVFLARVRAVVDAQQAGDINIMIGSLNDMASGCIAWGQWLSEHRQGALAK